MNSIALLGIRSSCEKDAPTPVSGTKKARNPKKKAISLRHYPPEFFILLKEKGGAAK